MFITWALSKPLEIIVREFIDFKITSCLVTQLHHHCYLKEISIVTNHLLSRLYLAWFLSTLIDIVYKIVICIQKYS